MCKGEHSSSKRVLLAERFFCFLKFGALTSIKKKTRLRSQHRLPKLTLRGKVTGDLCAERAVKRQADTKTQWNTSQVSLFYSFH